MHLHTPNFHLHSELVHFHNFKLMSSHSPYTLIHFSPIHQLSDFFWFWAPRGEKPKKIGASRLFSYFLPKKIQPNHLNKSIFDCFEFSNNNQKRNFSNAHYLLKTTLCPEFADARALTWYDTSSPKLFITVVWYSLTALILYYIL